MHLYEEIAEPKLAIDQFANNVTAKEGAQESTSANQLQKSFSTYPLAWGRLPLWFFSDSSSTA